MILKSTRIPTEDTADIAAYFDDPGENEEITWIEGDSGDIRLMGRISGGLGKPFSVRHMSVSPAQELSDHQWDRVREMIAEEPW